MSTTPEAMRVTEKISTAEFIGRAKQLGLPLVQVSLAWSIDDRGKVCTFDFVLLASLDAQGVSPDIRGTVQHVTDIRFNRGPLSHVWGIDDPEPYWFSDGPRLQGDAAYLSTVRQFTEKVGRQTTAKQRVGQFFALLEQIDAAGLQFQLVGSGIKPILAWVEEVHPSEP